MTHIINKKCCDCTVIHEKTVAEVKKMLPEDEVLLNMADFYKALSDSTRIKIIAAIATKELCVCDISYLLNMTKSAISHQLRTLREMKLIKCRKQGKEIFYSLADKHVDEVFRVSLEHVMEEINVKES